jgi:hypothetical protein
MATPQSSESFASPWGNPGSSPTATIVSINDAKNRVQCRIDGYQDDKGNIVDEKTAWYDTLSTMHSGIAGATGTHMYYVGSKVAISSCGRFVQGSITGYDSDKKKDGADASEDKDPNTPEQVRGSKGRSDISAGEGKDTSSKGTREPKVDEKLGQPKADKVYDYSKDKAPFDKGSKAMFPDLKSIGIDKLTKGSDVLSVIDGMDNNVSGAIQAGTKIIKNLRQNGWGAVSSLIGGGGGGGGGSAGAGAAQVTSFFGATIFEDIILALTRLLAAHTVMKDLKKTTPIENLFDIPDCLRDQNFNVDLDLVSQIADDVSKLKLLFGTDVDASAVILDMQGKFDTGFGIAVVNCIAAVERLVAAAGPAILVQGANSVERLLALVAAISCLKEPVPSKD